MDGIDYSTASPEIVQEEAKGLITATEFHLFLNTTSCILIAVALFGIVTNIINIKTFTAMGAFSDGINLTFLYLSVSDVLLCFWALFAAVFSGLLLSHETRVLPQLHLSTPGSHKTYTGFIFPMDPTPLGIVGLNMIQVFNLTTISITIYLAVARCLGVLQPLKFRDSVSVRNTSIFFSISFLLSLTSRLPLLAHTDIVMMFDKRFNSSRPTLSFKPNRVHIKDITWLAVDMTGSVIAQIILLICIYILLRSLRAAVRFRSRAVRGGQFDLNQDQDKPNKDMRKTPSRENRIAKQMLLVSAIFLVCNTPKLLLYVATNVVPDFDYDGQYRYTYLCSVSVQVIFDTLNSSLNIFVYNSYNSKFSKALLGKN
ncbi:hypothetical protein RRG08_045071 [Elysia crispata]|uniref:G-protein coupled receptors family 1 profile domain-containing protein n=1 Tax=Elysia crispata TaxID=231223 RepID=A0AAE1CZ71_9GAST|nr:hypothetical protein RRG08_045071 [Elysia crispata]